MPGKGVTGVYVCGETKDVFEKRRRKRTFERKLK